MFHFLLRRPVISLVLGFLITILIGTALLNLPWATHRGISFIDALFTATSATCVTGLIVRDTGYDFTLFGQIVILFLIQLGGLGIITGAALVFLLFGKRIGIRVGAGFKTILEEEYISEVRTTIKFIIKSTFLLEAIGAILLFFWWRGIFPDFSQAAFSSIFHSIAAFCNAGFSLFRNNLENFTSDVSVNIVISSLIILGGIGFLVLEDFYKNLTSFFKNFAVHIKPTIHTHQRIKLTLHSKIVLISTVLLILFGAILFYLFEKGNLSYLSQKELVLSSFFQSITARTAGFNTVNIGSLTSPTLLLLIFLMFIGAAPGGTGGGIKVVSLALIFLSIVSFFKRKEEIVIFGRTIPKIKFRAVFILVSVYLSFCLVIFLLLLYTERVNFEKILFEVFSAMGTVGLSTGITSHLTSIGKILIIIAMFTGRLLPLSIAILASRELVKPKIIYPEEKIILG
jgi:trk system potassium uptake protein TrkH